MCNVVCKDNEHDGFFSHGEHLCKNMIFYVPKFALHDPLMRGTHGESLVRHDGLKFKDRWIVHIRGKIKFLVHGCRISLLIFNSHWIDMAMEFVLKCPRSKRGKHYLILFGSFLLLVFDPGGWIGKHINNKRFLNEFKYPQK